VLAVPDNMSASTAAQLTNTGDAVAERVDYATDYLHSAWPGRA
jgi:hypothetical protein